MLDGPLLTNALIILCAPKPVIAGKHPAYTLGPRHLHPVQVPVVAQLRLGLAHLQHRVACSITGLEQQLCIRFWGPVSSSLSRHQSLLSSVWVWLTCSGIARLKNWIYRASTHPWDPSPPPCAGTSHCPAPSRFGSPAALTP